VNLVYLYAAHRQIYIETLCFIAPYLVGPSYDVLVLLDPRLNHWWNRRRLRRARLNSFGLPHRTSWDRWFNKIRIFEYPEVGQYDKILYLDSDILVNLSLDKVFDIDFPTDNLCVSRYNDDPTHEHFSLPDQPYTSDELTRLAEHDIGTFCAGTFLLHSSPDMRQHFHEILRFAEAHAESGRKFFVDQSFLNYHFNRLTAVDYGLTPFVREWPDPDERYPDQLIHFLGGPGDAKRKLGEMRTYAKRFL